MDNPFCDISDPEQLRALVQDGAECEHVDWVDIGSADCPTCSGTGHTPLPNADLDALAACWCEGVGVIWREKVWSIPVAEHGRLAGYSDIPAYTTSPDAAMRLQVKYNLGATPFGQYGLVQAPGGVRTQFQDNTAEARCHAITTAALIVALTEAIEGASE